MGGHQNGFTEFVSCSFQSESGEYYTMSTADVPNTPVNGS